MGRPKLIKDPKIVRYIDDREFVADVDRAVSLLGWTRASFMRAAARQYLKLAITKIHGMENPNG